MAEGKSKTGGMEVRVSSEKELDGFEAELELGSSKMEAINWRSDKEKLRRWKEESGWRTLNCWSISSHKKFCSQLTKFM